MLYFPIWWVHMCSIYICIYAIYVVPTISYMHWNIQLLYIGVNIYKPLVCVGLHVFAAVFPSMLCERHGEQDFFCAASSFLPGTSAHFLLRALQCSV